MGRGVVHNLTPLLVADDLGFTRGDGCFDAARVTIVYGSPRVDHLDRHLARFARSAAALELHAPDAAAWQELIDAALDEWSSPGEAVLKLVLTRGPEHSATGVTALLTVTAAGDASVARRGVRAATLARGYASDGFAASPWLLGGVKTLS